MARFACAVMHCLFRDGKADWDYLDKYTDAPRELEAHLKTRDPQWASAITGCPVETIEAFAKLVGENKRSYFRLGYGFALAQRPRSNMHAASCIPAVTGAWLHEGGGALPQQRRHLSLEQDRSIEGQDLRDPSVRMTRPVARRRGARPATVSALQGRAARLTAMLIQNTNPVSVCARPGGGEAASPARTCSSASTSSS